MDFFDPANLLDLDAQYFGDGSDGNATINGAVTLIRDMYYDTLTIAAGASLTTNGFRIFARTLDVTAAPTHSIRFIANNGGNASNNTAGAIPGQQNFVQQTLGVGGRGVAGVAGGTGAGTQGVAGTVANPAAHAGLSGAGAQGGLGTNAGGATRVSSTPSVAKISNYTNMLNVGTLLMLGGQGGSSGGGGGGSGAGNAGGSGGGGNGGNVIFIAARTIIRGAGTAASAVRARGGNGGNGGNGTGANQGGGGGGGGGAGGHIRIFYRYLSGSLPPSDWLDVAGGNGGNGGSNTNAAPGVGQGGYGGGAGAGGFISIYNVQNLTITDYNGPAAVGQVANSGVTGGTGAVATAATLNL